MLVNYRYKNIIPLGYYCGICQELERKGFRKCSLPFDWLITENFEKVLLCVQSSFRDFLNRDNLRQEVEVNPNYYYDVFWEMHFYHDFISNTTLESQYEGVYNKYERRIKRFQILVQQPSLFLRYLSNPKDVEYVQSHYNEINSYIKSLNANSDILYFIDSKHINICRNLCMSGGGNHHREWKYWLKTSLLWYGA